jgi:hypothetical protein
MGFTLDTNQYVANAIQLRHFASLCLVDVDPGWADGLILLGSPDAGEGLL